jgi:hypothetical protein
MLIWAAAIVFGVVTGLLSGGSLGAVASYRFKAWPLLVVALGLEITLGALPTGLRHVVAPLAALAVAAWCAANFTGGRVRQLGQVLLTLGVVLNLLVMSVNDGMPVSRAALGAAGLPPAMDIARGDLYKHTAITAHTHLAFLGDIVPIRLAHTVMSVGDLVMLLGIAFISWAATSPHRHAAAELEAVAG